MTEILDGVTVRVDGNMLVVKGPKGELKRKIVPLVTIKVEGQEVTVSSANPALIGTNDAIIKNMMNGVKNGYSRKLKLIYAHFPISLEIKGKNIKVKNFLGEKLNRSAALVGDGTKVEAKGQSVTISGPDKEAVGQTIANLRSAMRIRDKDGRIFQDGIYDDTSGE
jgi:large subunit ribosomal protein L6